MSELIDTILGYRTKHQRMIEEAHCFLPAVSAFASTVLSKTYERFCTVCGKSFLSSRPDDPVCSVECSERYEVEIQEYAEALLSANTSRALSILDENPLKEYVYFVRGVGSGRIKIGYSLDVESRVSALQTASSERLELLCAINGDKQLEAALHKRFDDLRSHGEWFEPADRLLNLIEDLKKSENLQGGKGV